MRLIKNIYLDNNATTQPDPEIYAYFVEVGATYWANPSSVYRFGQEAKSLLNQSRKTCAQLFGVLPKGIIFTSSGTEALNLLIRGCIGSRFAGHIITSAVEHAAVLETCRALEKRGLEVTYLAPGPEGAPRQEEVEGAIRSDTRLIALMSANNETGVMTDVDAIAACARRAGIPCIVDAVAHFSKAPLSHAEGITAMVISGHKFHAPKGAGCIVLYQPLSLEPSLTGGGQEGGLRSGTENVAAIAAFARACTRVHEKQGEEIGAMRSLRDHFERQLLAALPASRRNGGAYRVANTSSITFLGIDGEALLRYLDLHGVQASLGSACSSGSLEPSHVLLGMGLSMEEAKSSLRFSLSRFTTLHDIDTALEIITAGVKKLGQIS